MKKCELCGKHTEITHTCVLCKREVCPSCYRLNMGVCKSCVPGKRKGRSKV
ncbi:MAG: hypothetical protein U9N35_08670 [Euryarchaeota archaeon]|nr:hypothetical protein [Euryarchaeota archaeon]